MESAWQIRCRDDYNHRSELVVVCYTLFDFYYDIYLKYIHN